MQCKLRLLSREGQWLDPVANLYPTLMDPWYIRRIMEAVLSAVDMTVYLPEVCQDVDQAILPECIECMITL